LKDFFGEIPNQNIIDDENPLNRININLQILKFSSKMLKFFVNDMLDFQQIKAKKL
jgi:hypothetical protein